LSKLILYTEARNTLTQRWGGGGYGRRYQLLGLRD